MSTKNNEKDMVMTLGYSDEEQLHDIPPKEKAPEELRVTVISPLALLAMAKRGEVAMVTVAPAKETSLKQARQVKMAKKHKLSEIPSEKGTRDEGIEH